MENFMKMSEKKEKGNWTVEMNWPNSWKTHNLPKTHRRIRISKCLQESSKNWLSYPICCPTEWTQGHMVSAVSSPIKGQRTLIACQIFQKVNVETPILSTWEPVTPVGSHKASIVTSSTSFHPHRHHRGGCFAVWEGIFIIMTRQGGNQTEWRYSH